MQRANSSSEKKPRDNTAKAIEVVFTIDRPAAQAIYLCGSFNDWVADSLRMVRRQSDGRWERRLILHPGRYEYKFVVDGEWIHDSACSENVSNEFGTWNSVCNVEDKAVEHQHSFVRRKTEPVTRKLFTSIA